MRVRIHRGAHEIGGSCVEIETGGESIIVDAGLPLETDACETPSLPSIDVGALRGIVVSHPHRDHYGLLPSMPAISVMIGGAARRILKAAAPFVRQPMMMLDGPDLMDRQVTRLGPFQITPYLVDHSAFDSYGLLIEADGRRLFYSGDIRTHGRKRHLVEKLITSPPRAINTLLLEGTTLGRSGGADQSSEDQVEGDLAGIFQSTAGLALVQTSAQNIDRMVSIYRACQKTHRTLVIDLYTAEILAATGNPNIPCADWEGVALCIPQRQRVQIKDNGWFESLNRLSRHRIYPQALAENPGAYVLLFRNLWRPDLDRANCLAGACLIHSMWSGYRGGDGYAEIDAWRIAHGMPLHQVHTSGHASPSELKRIAIALAPDVLVPIHSEMPERYGDLYSHVSCHADGEWWPV